MSAVWVVRPPVMAMQWPIQYHGSESTARMVLQMHHNAGIDSTLTRETLLTPAQAAVLGAATVYCDNRTVANEHDLIDAVATLREQEGA